MKAKIVILPGDGIGPEVTGAAVRVLEHIGKKQKHAFSFTSHLIGGISIDAHGGSLTDETLAACKASDAVLLGAVGGPKWDNPLAKVRPEQGLLALRKGLGLYANLRPVKTYPALLNASPLKPEFLHEVDMIVVRELTGVCTSANRKAEKKSTGMFMLWTRWITQIMKSNASSSLLSSLQDHGGKKSLRSIRRTSWKVPAYGVRRLRRSGKNIRPLRSKICWSIPLQCD